MASALQLEVPPGFSSWLIVHRYLGRAGLAVACVPELCLHTVWVGRGGWVDGGWAGGGKGWMDGGWVEGRVGWMEGGRREGLDGWKVGGGKGWMEGRWVGGGGKGLDGWRVGGGKGVDGWMDREGYGWLDRQERVEHTFHWRGLQLTVLSVPSYLQPNPGVECTCTLNHTQTEIRLNQRLN